MEVILPDVKNRKTYIYAQNFEETFSCHYFSLTYPYVSGRVLLLTVQSVNLFTMV